jgi:uncharacterized membrane protein
LSHDGFQNPLEILALIDDLILARAIHVLSVVIWIGGVYFVTFIVLPALKHTDDKVIRFETVEIRFTKHARIVVTLAGLSGFYMLYRLDGWEWFQNTDYWWVHAMTLLWLVFTFVLFVAEPLFLHAWFIRRAEAAPEQTLALATRFHQVMTILSLITVVTTIYGVHG